MDRIILGKLQVGQFILFAFLAAALGLISIKAVNEGWFARREPLDLSDAPVLLFFNRHKGCECEMVVYDAAEGQINRWSDEARFGMQIVRIDLDRRPDLGTQFDIVRAPALFRVDQEGKVISGQKDSLSDAAPLDLTRFELAIKEQSNGK